MFPSSAGALTFHPSHFLSSKLPSMRSVSGLNCIWSAHTYLHTHTHCELWRADTVIQRGLWGALVYKEMREEEKNKGEKRQRGEKGQEWKEMKKEGGRKSGGDEEISVKTQEGGKREKRQQKKRTEGWSSSLEISRTINCCLSAELIKVHCRDASSPRLPHTAAASASVFLEVAGLRQSDIWGVKTKTRKVTPGVQPGWSSSLGTTVRPLKVNDTLYPLPETVPVFFPTFMKSTVITCTV